MSNLVHELYRDVCMNALKDNNFFDSQVVIYILDTTGPERDIFVEEFLKSSPWAAKSIMHIANYYDKPTEKLLTELFGNKEPVSQTD